MLPKRSLDWGRSENIIRALVAYGLERKAQIGADKVFDFSIGNPNVPAPPCVARAFQDLLQEDPVEVHAYTAAAGLMSLRQAIAREMCSLSRVPFEARHVYVTSGASTGLAVCAKALLLPGEKAVTFAPFFPEYTPYVNDTGAVLKVVPARTEDFQINFDAFEKMLDDNVAAVLINSPNNPSGIVYSEETLKELASMLTDAQKKYGHDIFLISDEPYREIVFDGKKCPYPSNYYANTLSCYSFSKGLSLPGERIGYIAVNPAASGADILVPIFGQISRGIGHNCPTATMQLGVARVIDETADLSVYETNMNLIYDKLIELGFTVVRPGGTFYVFPKALEDDAYAFSKKALKYDLILVPSDNFGCPGYFRMAYCIDTEKVKRSLPVLEKFVKEEYGK